MPTYMETRSSRLESVPPSRTVRECKDRRRAASQLDTCLLNFVRHGGTVEREGRVSKGALWQRRRIAERKAAVSLKARQTRSGIRRCPACGQRIESLLAVRCPLCDFAFGDERVTGADVTPFARAFACGEPGWRRMSEWIWFAGPGRLKHLALMRASAASRRFALINLLVLASGMGLAETSRVSWHRTIIRGTAEPASMVRPAGQGWLQVAAVPRAVGSHRGTAARTALWWNPAQAVIVLVVAALASLIASSIGMLLTRVGVTAAHTSRFRKEQRMTAAIHYSTCWGLLVALGAVAVAFRPISYLAAARQWLWFPPPQSFLLAAATMSGIGLVLWWFWLVRLGATAPKTTRSRVTGFLALGTPVLTAALLSGWWLGLERLCPVLFDRLDLAF